MIVTVCQRALGWSPVFRALLLVADHQEQQADRAEQSHQQSCSNHGVCDLTDGHISSETVMQSPSRPSSESVVVVQFARTKAFSAVA